MYREWVWVARAGPEVHLQLIGSPRLLGIMTERSREGERGHMKRTPRFSRTIPIVPLFLLASCGGDVTGPVNPGNDPNFTIVAHSDQGFTATNRKVEVF